MRLTKYEKETIILSSEGDKTWNVYTYNAGLKRRLADYASKYPDQCWLISRTEEGSVTYVVNKARLSFRLTAPYSDERRNAASEQMKTLIVQN